MSEWTEHAVPDYCREAAIDLIKQFKESKYTPADTLITLILALLLVFKNAKHGEATTPEEFAGNIARSLAAAIAYDVELERGGEPVQ